MYIFTQEEFEDTKRVIRIGKSKKDRVHNGQKEKDKQPFHIEDHVSPTSVR